MSSETDSTADKLLRSSIAGSKECLGQLMQIYTNYLKLLVASQMDVRLRARVSPSDVVQDTFYEAHRDFSQFRGRSTAEFLGWLRKILVNNLASVVEKHIKTAKRDVRREVSLEKINQGLDYSTARLEAMIALDTTSPSGCLQRREREIQLANQLALLSDDYRDVLMMRHLKGLSFKEIGEQLDRSPGAIRMLWLRALKQLREQLAAEGLIE